MTNTYWNYFISLERDFIRTLDFVDLSAANANAYGDNFAKLLLAIGSEVDVVAKAVCAVVSPASRPDNIGKYREIFTAAFAEFHTASIQVVRTGEEITPWAECNPAGPNQSPTWWKAYNEVKHDRGVNFAKATQINTLQALAGLLVLNLYFYRTTQEPYPQLLNGGTPDHVVIGATRKMPGLEE